MQKARREGKIRLHVPPGQTAEDRAELKKLIEVARARMTQSVSLRVPRGDLYAAKRLAEKTGKGYQTVLKDIIPEGVAKPGA